MDHNSSFYDCDSQTFIFGSSATLTFIGQAVKIYGTVGPTSASYAVQIDGGSASIYNAMKQASFPQMLLYYANNLGAGTHNLTITHQSTAENLNLFINYALVDKSGTTGYFSFPLVTCLVGSLIPIF